ncbi:MAG: hypothetical protein JSV96_05840 [Candidatus Aminicenantes bacterium]|nr:MAG: hypothetical protein JSV96_05840 [Candidatus Aminicenantes bacterium]
MKRIAEKFNPTIVVIDTTKPSISNDIKIAEALEKAFPTAFIALVRAHASTPPVETLKVKNPPAEPVALKDLPLRMYAILFLQHT